MNRLEAALRHAADALTSLGHRWALVGGLAVSARAEPRTTRDVDLVVAVTDDAEAEAIVYALQRLGYGVEAVLEQTRVHRLATVRLISPVASRRRVLVDLLFASSGIEREVVANAEPLALAKDLQAPVATIGDLLALKLLAHDDRKRPQDWDDIRALLEEATATDIDDARTALRLIEARGFQRGKDLAGALDRWLSSR